jgi:hypothetical protein
MTDAEARQWSIGRGITAENYIADSLSKARGFHYLLKMTTDVTKSA